MTSIHTKQPAGRFAKMTRKQFVEYVAEFDKSDNLAKSRPLTKRMTENLERAKRGRPPKASDAKSVKVMLSMPPDLLAKTDAYAKKVGMTRAGLVQAALAAAMRDRLKPAS